jgi:hypothetical protein
LRVKELARTPRFASYLMAFAEPWFFADAAQAAQILQRAGFTNVQASVESALTVLDDARQYEEFVSSIVLRPHLQQLPSHDLRTQFMAELTAQAAADNPPYSLDYWRLNLSGNIA